MYAEIILPLAIQGTFTYRVPADLSTRLQPGQRVVVPLGARKLYTGIVHSIHQVKPTRFEVKEIQSLLDESPVVTPVQLSFWDWLSSYYLCSTGEVYKAALPSGLKLESETKIMCNPGSPIPEDLEGEEYLLYTLIRNREMITIQEIDRLTGIRYPRKILANLLDRQLVFNEEIIKDTYRPKTISLVYLDQEYHDELNLNNLIDKLHRAPKQLQLLMVFLEHRGDSLSSGFVMDKKKLLSLSGSSPDALKALLDKKVLVIRDEEAESEHNPLVEPCKSLNPAQAQALEEINMNFASKDTVLLHGVTSSGKTEIYIHLIREQLSKGKQVLYLLPEIALTTQIISRLTRVFGTDVEVYHSRFPDNERVRVWKSMMSTRPGQGKLVLGARSAVFLPYSSLGLIIVDEEHETSYKQYDPAPRYHARDAAIVLGKLHEAKILLGTATPAIETYYNASQGKYGLVELLTRFQDLEMPRIEVANTREARKRKRMRSVFTPLLFERVQQVLEKGEQVILFQNRRGFSPYVQCDDCAWIPYCKHCDVSMTYHRANNQLVCHYCGYTTRYPRICESCGSSSIKTMGFGTEKIEEETSILFPGAKIARMDLDTTRSRRSYEQIIRDLEEKRVDILIGTQMVSKGLDFEHVSLVGILDADQMLNYPDFRAHERSYQLMAQVSGRAGRKYKQGNVIIQTSDPRQFIIQSVIDNDFGSMYSQQLKERYQYKYPPFYRLIHLRVKHRDEKTTEKCSEELANSLTRLFGKRVIGPEWPLANRVQRFYQKDILLKIEKTASSVKAKEILVQEIHRVLSLAEYKSAMIIPDVDPL